MANLPNRPKGRSVRNLRMVWSFAVRYPGRIAIAALALLIAAGATSGVPYAFKLIIDKGFAHGAGTTRDIARWFEYLLLLVGIMVRSNMQSSLGGPIDGPYGNLQRQAQDEMMKAISLGLGTYLSVSVALYFAALSTKQFLVARGVEGKKFESSQKAAA